MCDGVTKQRGEVEEWRRRGEEEEWRRRGEEEEWRRQGGDEETKTRQGMEQVARLVAGRGHCTTTPSGQEKNPNSGASVSMTRR
ncbi:unnamed protein product [Pleuronectes platessa]|uniref:Uncharacterized protein n=1 Tax=Pleuronectes platessa TaxID=8262 RepID=A0A9N7VQW0_PLEPL|nr:unnamed protein product [Pleuronectes platessa]